MEQVTNFQEVTIMRQEIHLFTGRFSQPAAFRNMLLCTCFVVLWL